MKNREEDIEARTDPCAVDKLHAYSAAAPGAGRCSCLYMSHLHTYKPIAEKNANKWLDK